MLFKNLLLATSLSFFSGKILANGAKITSPTPIYKLNGKAVYTVSISDVDNDCLEQIQKNYNDKILSIVEDDVFNSINNTNIKTFEDVVISESEIKKYFNDHRNRYGTRSYEYIKPTIEYKLKVESFQKMKSDMIANLKSSGDLVIGSQS